MRVGDAGQRGRAEAQAAGTHDSGLSELVRGCTALWQDRALRVLAIAAISAGSMIGAFGFLLGLVWGTFNALFSTLVQRRIRPEEQGRVYGVQLASFYAAPPIGIVIAGISVDSLGVSATYLALGLLLAACALPIVFLRSIRDLDNTRE